MQNINEVLKSAVEGGNVQEKIEQATGTYSDKVTDAKDQGSKLPFVALPQGTDPSPFSIGKVGERK